MISADTLAVIAIPGEIQENTLSNLDDLIRSLRWSCKGSLHILIGTPHRGLTIDAAGDDCTIVEGCPAGGEGTAWAALAALNWAMEDDAEFQQAIILQPDVLVIGEGLDLWGLDNVRRERVGLIGVGDVNRYGAQYASIYKKTAQHLSKATPGHASAQIVVVEDTGLLLSYNFARAAAIRQLLSAPGIDRLADDYVGIHLSYLAGCLGFHVVTWGSARKPIPPLYLAHSRVVSPPPHLLTSQFLLFNMGASLCAYTEAEVRDHYRAMRGEIPPPPKFTPEVHRAPFGSVPARA